jgi:hypothetical protein
MQSESVPFQAFSESSLNWRNDNERRSQAKPATGVSDFRLFSITYRVFSGDVELMNHRPTTFRRRITFREDDLDRRRGKRHQYMAPNTRPGLRGIRTPHWQSHNRGMTVG